MFFKFGNDKAELKKLASAVAGFDERIRAQDVIICGQQKALRLALDALRNHQVIIESINRQPGAPPQTAAQLSVN